MTNKIAFFDIDGTLLNRKKVLPEATIKGIQELQSQGVYCAIATGRAPFMYKELRERLGITSYVSFNGQYVVFEGNEVYTNPMSVDHLADLHKDAVSNDHPMVFMDHEGMRASTPDHHHISESLGTLFIDHPEADESYYLNRNIYQSLLFCEGDELDYYKKHHDEAFDYIRWHRFSSDVLPKGGSKAEGIKRLIDAAGLSMKDVYAFGDGLNDLEMLEQAGVGVAMGNAVTEAKQVSDFITDDVDKDGLSKALYEVGLLMKS